MDKRLIKWTFSIGNKKTNGYIKANSTRELTDELDDDISDGCIASIKSTIFDYFEKRNQISDVK